MIDWPLAPKPEPTPRFDEWKLCPRCHSSAELRVHFKEKVSRRTGECIEQKLEVHFYCTHCEHESEVRSVLLDDMRIVRGD